MTTPLASYPGRFFGNIMAGEKYGLDQEPFKKLAHACKYGLLKQALYLKSKPEYCAFIIRSMMCVLTGRSPTHKW